MKKTSLISTALLTCLLTACAGSTNSTRLVPVNPQAVYGKARTPENFNDYVQFLKGKAEAEGVPAVLLNAQQNIRYMQKAVDLDRAQAGRVKKRAPNEPPRFNPNGTTNYLNKVLTNNKVDVAENRYWEVQLPLQRASRRYGVPQEYLLALWGMESSFGHYQGNYDVLSALATLAFDGRREPLFSKEFIAAMKMLNQDHIQREKMLGSWAGAMGQTQFMPSTFLRYAADGDGDGVKNIWTDSFDVFASIANYLSGVGWDAALPWGVEVVVTQPMSLEMAGIEQNKRRSLQDWQQNGVMLKNDSALDQDKFIALSSADLWLIRPDGENGRAFLVSNNFRTLMDWNKSNYFGISIGLFAERIKARLGL